MSQLTKYLKMEGGSIRLIEERVVEESSSEEWLEVMKSQSSISTGLMPRDCIFHFRAPADGNGKVRSVYVLEKEPKIIQITFKKGGRGSDSQIKRYRISLPFCLFFIPVIQGIAQELYVCCSKKKIVTVNDEVFVLPLPNMYDGGHGQLCTGGSGGMKMPKGKPLHIGLNSLVKDFFTSEFNRDLSFELPGIFANVDPNNNPDFTKWEELTKENPLVAISDKIEYRSHRDGTFNGILKRLGFNAQ